VDLVVREGRGSVSLLQRALGIGYGRAARLIDFMAEDGIVGQYNGSQAREILITLADWERMQGVSSDEAATPASLARSGTSAAVATSPQPKRNRVLPEPWEEDESSTETEDEDADLAASEDEDEDEADDGDEDEEYRAESA
jgi:S-DNA-T family DNA segregation ATPase FtsK/SpoIIIE